MVGINVEVSFQRRPLGGGGVGGGTQSTTLWQMNAVISNTSSLLFSLPVIFVLDTQGGGSDVFVWVFLKGHALTHSRKWEGHDFFRQKNSKIARPTPHNKKRTFPKRRGFFSKKASFYNGLYGKTPPERGIFFRLQVYLKEKGFHQLKYMKGQENLSIFSICKIAQTNANICILWL